MKIASSIAVLFAIYFSGAVAVIWLQGTFRVSRYLFVTVDMPGFAIAILTVAILAFVVHLLSGKWVQRLAEIRFERISIWPIVLTTAVISVLGTQFVYHGYALSMDEWMPRLQARLFQAGKLTGQVGPEWQDYGRAMFHIFATYDPDTGQVASSYRPGMAALIAVLDSVGLGVYISALMNAAAVGLVAVVTRQLHPASRSAPVVAALLLATSQQALAASMTSYAMTGQLFFNLLWLHLFLRGKWSMHFLAALVGVFTASLHQIHTHLFFALPFLATFLRPFRPRHIALYGVIYLFGHLAVMSWDQVLIRQVASGGSDSARTTQEIVAAIVQVPGLSDLATVWANLTRLIGWQNLALVPLLIALWQSDARAPWMRLLVASMALSLFPYLILMPDQGHGWGYRYLHGLLGHMAILAAVGWEATASGKFPARFRAFLAVVLIASPLAMIPLRAFQINRFVTPYFEATKLTMSQDADVVIVDSQRVFVGADIPRNDPLMPGRPVAMNLRVLTPEQIVNLCRTYQVKFLSADELGPLGLLTFDAGDLYDPEGYEARMEAMRTGGCRGGT